MPRLWPSGPLPRCGASGHLAADIGAPPRRPATGRCGKRSDAAGTARFRNNMNDIPLLTVAIPTYNRSETLERIIQQLGQEKDLSFLILISDDYSSDDTGIMVRKYQESLPNIIYHKNETNLGFSGNVCKLYELTTTRYLWFLCDDDTVLPGAVKNILEALIKYEPVVAIFNTTWINSYGQKLTAGPTKDVVYDDISRLADYQPLARITFLSIVVVEKRLPLDSITKNDYRDNIFFQLTLALLLLSDKFKFCEIASPVVHRNVGYKYGDFFKFNLIDHLKAAFLIEHKFDNNKFIKWSKKQLFSNLQLYLSQKLGLFKYNASPTKETIKYIIRYYGFHSIFIFSFPVLYFITPKFMFKSFYLLKLFSIYGYKEGIRVYNNNIKRTFIDTRKTKFTTYR